MTFEEFIDKFSGFGIPKEVLEQQFSNFADIPQLKVKVTLTLKKFEGEAENGILIDTVVKQGEI